MNKQHKWKSLAFYWSPVIVLGTVYLVMYLVGYAVTKHDYNKCVAATPNQEVCYTSSAHGFLGIPVWHQDPGQ